MQSKETGPAHRESLTYWGKRGPRQTLRERHRHRSVDAAMTLQLNTNSAQGVDMDYRPGAVWTLLTETGNARRVLRTGAVEDRLN